MPNPHPKTEHLPKQKTGWQHLPTKAVRVPEIFLEEIERYARSLDQGLSFTNTHTVVNDLDLEVAPQAHQDLKSAPLWGDVLNAVKNWQLEQVVKLQLELPAIIARKKEETCDRSLENCIIYLANRCDGAFSQDGAGFNGADTGFGHWLASQIRKNKPLLQAHAAAALKMVRKYIKQLERGGLSLPEWEAIAHQYPKNSPQIIIQNDEGVNVLPERRVEIKGEMIAVYAPYDSSGKFQRDCKSIEGYKFEGSDKSWRFPLLKIEKVIETLLDDDFHIAPEAEGAKYPIATKPVADLFPSLPPCYKVDIAHPEKKLAIEVDGNSHKRKKQQFLDKRKTAVLNTLGWSVLRFWNEEILSDLELVMLKVKQFIT